MSCELEAPEVRGVGWAEAERVHVRLHRVADRRDTIAVAVDELRDQNVGTGGIEAIYPVKVGIGKCQYRRLGASSPGCRRWNARHSCGGEYKTGNGCCCLHWSPWSVPPAAWSRSEDRNNRQAARASDSV